MPRRFAAATTMLIFSLGTSGTAQAYAVLSHEALVDALWDVKMKPLLVARYPGTTPEQLKEAHGYAYGGAIIQDMGYYPSEDRLFSDLTHYVRSGDFVVALVKESQNVDELAFALGALSHYVADNDGHRFATNPSEAILYPKLRAKFGDWITYEKDPAAHVKTEFGFDVLEVAKGNFAPEAYHDFIGFQVAVPVVERAFRDTYSLELSDLFRNLDFAVGSYRHAVSNTIPMATRVAWAQKGKEIEKASPGMTRRRFQFIMKRSSYEKEWGKQYDRPSGWDRFLAFILHLVPKVGPLRALQFKTPTPQVEDLFMKSFERADAQGQTAINDAAAKDLKLPNTNFDTGMVSKPGEYKLNDDTHAKLLDQLASKKFEGMRPDIRAELLTFYSNLQVPLHTKADPKKWQLLLTELNQLKATPENPVITSR